MNMVWGFILVLGVLILVHEWGHYIVARIFGVRVDVFSIGFGPRLFGIKRGATDWRVSAIPLGGYVRMAGQDITEIDSGDSMPTGAPDELMSKKRWQRALISFAGPAINLIFPLFLLPVFMLLKGEPYPRYFDQPVVILDIQKDSPLEKAGVVKGDRITSLDGVANPTWGSIDKEQNKGMLNRTFSLGVEHEGQLRNVEISTAGMKVPEALFGNPPAPAKIGYIDRSQPGYAGGLRRDDVIVAIAGQPIANWSQMVDVIRASQGQPLSITARRDGQLQTFTVTPKRGSNEQGETVFVIGIRPGYEETYRKVSVRQAITESWDKTIVGIGGVLVIVERLVTGRLPARELQSVIGIANEAGHAVKEGSSSVIQLMALMSINLGILNLLPIPILDGGHILLLSLEGLRRRDFSLAFKERFMQVGLVFLLALFAYVMYNDIARLLPRHS